MDFLDKVVPLAVLGTVAALVVFLMRRNAQKMDFAPRSTDSPMPVKTQPEPAKIDESNAKRLEPALVVAPQPVTLPPTAPQRLIRPAKRKRPPVPGLASPLQHPPTPIAKAIELLQDKDSLVAVFLLREILAPPLSRRQN